MTYLLIGYMCLFIHRPFEVWPWLAELRIERVYMICTILYWMMQPKTWFPLRSHFPVFLLAGVYLIASQTSPYASFATVEDWFKVFVFYVLLVTTIRSEKELQMIVIGYVCVMAIYQLHSLREYFNGRGVWRMGTWRMIGVDETMSDPNTFGASIVYFLPFIYPVWTLARERWYKQGIVAVAALGVGCILLTGSRSAFAALIFLAALVSLASKFRWRILAAMVLIPPLIWVNLRADLQERYMTLIDPSRGPKNAEASAEGRTKSFWDGMHSFAENPLFGAGLDSYRARRGGPTHNLYNQAMGELGVFGLLVLIGFARCFVANYREARRLVHEEGSDEQFLYRVCQAGLLACLLLFFLGWGSHNLARYNWLWFGAFTGIAVQRLRIRTDLRCIEEAPTDLAYYDDVPATRPQTCAFGH
jgi:O-antigen ligase